MATTTVFRKFSEPVGNKGLMAMMKEIKGGAYMQAVMELRVALAEGREAAAEAIKNSLPAFTPHASFKGKRTGKHVDRYSGFVHLDFDKLNREQLDAALAVFVACPYTAYCFRSPSGNGLKVFVEVNSGIEQHVEAYKMVQAYYEELSGLKADPKCKDIPRLCFVSYDPQLWKNLGAEKFPVFEVGAISMGEKHPPAGAQDPQHVPLRSHTGHTPHTSTALSAGGGVGAGAGAEAGVGVEGGDFVEMFRGCVAFTEKVKTYAKGSRNEFVYTLASNCNRRGLPEPAALEMALEQYTDLASEEVKKAFRSAYLHHVAEKGAVANLANLAKLANKQEAAQAPEEPTDDYLMATPKFPDKVFAVLPAILRKGCEVFEDRRQRDVFLTGALSIISGCLPEVTGVYHQERVYPHLCSFVTAPAGSGKGVLKNAKRLAEAYHKQVIGESKEAAKQYEQDEEAYKDKQRTRKKKGPEAPSEKPEMPAFKVVFIPADCSMARMVDHLYQNGGSGIICETEADTMSGAKKQDWGDYSHMLRQAFHHETISLSRKTGNEYKEVEAPRMAVALSGTPSQVPKLIASAEDGLFSRFLFYAYRTEMQWKDPSPVNQPIVYNDHFEALSKEVLKLVGFMERQPTEVRLRDHQWAELNARFTNMLADVTMFVSLDASSTVLRLGLILFRLCMIFTALRKFEDGEAGELVYCSDEDFGSAVAIVDTFLEHATLMFHNLPKQEESVTFNASCGKRRFFDALAAEFSRNEAVELGKSYQLSKRTVDRILGMAADSGRLERVKEGVYRKKGVN
jgi:hypothetical protein